jgi:hypothetical protein
MKNNRGLLARVPPMRHEIVERVGTDPAWEGIAVEWGVEGEKGQREVRNQWRGWNGSGVGHRDPTLVSGQCMRGGSTGRWGEARGVILGPSLEEMGAKWGRELLALAREGAHRP